MKELGGEKMSNDPRNVWLSACIDGVNPHNQGTTRSMMCVVMSCYNYAPAVRGNYSHLDVWGIYDGKPKNAELVFDVLVDDLEYMWKHGATVWDGNTEEYVKIHAMLVNLLHDYPGLPCTKQNCFI
jgi:hypothetical protein